MRKILPIFLAALLFLIVHPRVLAAPVSIDPVIASSRAAGSPPGDCIGPDGNHFQATKEVCNTFNLAWGKKTAPFEVGKPSPLPPTTPITEVIAAAQANGSPEIDCTGPDKKVFKAAKEVCDKLNIDWKKTPPAPIVIGAVTPTAASDLSQTINTSLAKGSPLGDCMGPDKKHFDATKEVCDTFNKNWGKTASFNPGVTTGVGIQSAVSASSGSTGSGGSSAGSSNSGAGGSSSSGSQSKSFGGSSGSSVSSPSQGSSGGGFSTTTGGSSASKSTTSGGSNAGSSATSSNKNEKKSDNKKEKKDNKD